MTRTFRNGIVLQSKWRARTSWEQATSDLISLGMCRLGWVVVVVAFGWDNSKRITKWKIKCRHGSRWRIGNVSRPWRTFFLLYEKKGGSLLLFYPSTDNANRILWSNHHHRYYHGIHRKNTPSTYTYRSFLSVGTNPIRFTTFIPSFTRPKMVCLPIYTMSDDSYPVSIVIPSHRQAKALVPKW